MGCKEILALLLLVISVILTVISFVSPYWIVDDNGEAEGSPARYWGLYYRCKPNCEWFMDNDFLVQNKLPGRV